MINFLLKRHMALFSKSILNYCFNLAWLSYIKPFPSDLKKSLEITLEGPFFNFNGAYIMCFSVTLMKV